MSKKLVLELDESEAKFIKGVLSLLKDHPTVKYKIDPDEGNVVIHTEDKELRLQLGTAVEALKEFYGVE